MIILALTNIITLWLIINLDNNSNNREGNNKIKGIMKMNMQWVSPYIIRECNNYQQIINSNNNNNRDSKGIRDKEEVLFHFRDKELELEGIISDDYVMLLYYCVIVFNIFLLIYYFLLFSIFIRFIC